jgi:hypothetical protein
MSKMCVMLTLYVDTTFEEPELLRYVLDKLTPEQLSMADAPVVLERVVADGIEPTVEPSFMVKETTYGS